ncbi:MAG: DEAD/DEAH box helicase [Gemmatimonadota bacterium]|nr:DEAD/DEAH box helicase [Gemmatimonadota bacterium]
MRERGERYFAERRVELLQHDDAGATARVRGTERWSAWLRAERGELVLGCGCPYARDVGACKHLWALVLVLETGGMLGPMLQRVGAIERARIYFDPESAHLAAHDAQPELAGSPTDPANLARHWRALAGQQTPRPGAPGSAPSWPEHLRLVYIIDLDASITDAALVVEVATEKINADGSTEPPILFRAGRAMWEAAPDPADRVIAQMLLGARETTQAWWHQETVPATFLVRASSFEPTLRMICETGRARVRGAHREHPSPAVRWDGGAPYGLTIRIRDTDDADMLRIDAVLERDGESLPLDAASVIHIAGVAVIGDAIAGVDYRMPFPWLQELRQCSSLAIPRGDLGALLDVMYQQPRLPNVELPAGTVIDEITTSPVPCVSVTMTSESRWSTPHHRIRVAFSYGDGLIIDAAEPRRSLFQVEHMRVINRDARAERDAMRRLRVLGAREDVHWRGTEPVLGGSTSSIDRIIRELPGEGWRVMIDGVARRTLTSVSSSVSSGIDWFDLTAEVRFGEHVAPLSTLIESFKRGDATVMLRDGSMGMLQGELAERLAALAAMATVENGAIRFRRSQVALLDLLLASLPEVDVDATFATARAELRAFEQLMPVDAPASFSGTLRPYQREGLAWLQFLQRFGLGGCLADDMGLGKTIQVLALLARRREEKAGASLVVVPRSLVFNWKQEAARFAPELRVLDHSIAGRGAGALDVSEADLVLTTYGTLRRDAPELRDVEFDYVILDEAQAIKNAGTATSKAARLLRARHRLALTGTPVENRIEELWSLMDFLNPGMLGASTRFRTLMADDAPEQRAMLSRALRPVMLRRTKDEVARDLPPRVEQTLMVELEPAQRRFYDELLAASRSELLSRVDQMGIARSKILILEALLRLRQAACHPGLIDRVRVDESSAKLDMLVPMLAEARDEGHKTLVFSQFTSFLALLRPRLDELGLAYAYLDGRTRNRQAAVEQFQTDPACSLFLVSLKAGGHGLNLTAADYVFLLDPWWNPAVEAQAIDRAHRIGQARQVIATRLVARDTIEEKIIELQQRKRELAESILGEDKSLIGRIGREELEMLLG